MLQLSLDLAKAYDRLPRRLLRAALEGVQAPDSLITLILFIHDNAQIVINRHQSQERVGMGRGIRQGCGLSPLLWITFTLLIHDKLSLYVPLESQTSYADDFHVQWEFSTEQGFRHACVSIPRILQDLASLGMEVSLSKTVVLLAVKGTQAPKLLRTFTKRVKGERILCIQTPQGSTQLPIRRAHDYLGIKISYYNFEKLTMQHRLRLSWVAMHRLHDLLKHRLLPLRKRTLLWQSCVWSVANFGLTATGLDPTCAQQFHSGIMKQLRTVARSPPHVSHETNEQMLIRLHLPDPLQWLTRSCTLRIQNCRALVGHLQPPRVHQWWSILPASFRLPDAPTQGMGVLTEVTQILRIQCHCSECGQSFPSAHALKVHMGKSHPELQPRHEPNPTIKNQRKDEYRQYTVKGMPQCRFCMKKFYGWPQFMGHFSQSACPVLHKPPQLNLVHRSFPPPHPS